MNYQYSKKVGGFIYDFDQWERNIIRKGLRIEHKKMAKKITPETKPLVERLEAMIEGLGAEYRH